MKVIGIELHTPTRKGLVVLAVMSLVCIAATLFVASLGIIPAAALVPVMVGVVGGNLAAACGCSIPDQGFRAVILTTAFSIALMGLCVGLIYLTELFK